MTSLLIIALIAGLYMAWNIGANDVANAMGTSVGSGALTLRRAIILAGIFEFAGAFLVGSNVADTIKGGIVPVDAFVGSPEAFGLGMLAALIASALWLNVATFFGQPVSTTHSVIGAVIGFALISPLAGPGVIKWSNMGTIAASWFISPLAGGLLAYAAYRLIVRFVLKSRHPIYMARAAVPIGLAAVIAIIFLSIFYKAMPRLRVDLPLAYALLLMLAIGLFTYFVTRGTMKWRTGNNHIRFKDRHVVVEQWFGRLQVVTACFMAFAHGANDVANAIGPVAGCIQAFTGGALDAKMPVPPWLLAVGGVGIVLGLATYGYKVIEAVGKKITEITPTRGFAAEFGTATTVLVCSKLGLPVSTTFVLVGAVMGIGVARGFGSIDLKVIRKIFTSWIITIPVSAALSAMIYTVLLAIYN